MSSSTFLKIKELLDKNNVVYTHLTHDHVTTSEHAAQVRGTRLDQAAKALVCNVQLKDGSKERIQLVLPADQRLDLKKVKQALESKNVSLASPDDVLEKTDCTIGSVPPFGNIFGLKVYLDRTILEKEQIVFSAGTHNDSIIMNPEDYFRIVGPNVGDFRKS